MQLSHFQPYLFTSPRMVALVDRPQMVPTEGPVADPIYGYHTLWAAEVPFIPAHASRDDRDFDAEATNRISRAVQRQVRFLYDLAQSRDNLSTFELRLVARPQPGGAAKVGIVFLGKTFHPNEQMSRKIALGLWDKFSAIFPREVPFSYPLIPVCEHPQTTGIQTYGFQQWYEPIPFAKLTNFASIVELRKYEDWPTLRNIGGVYHAHDYIPHPFVPALDYSAMARLFETMAHQNSTCIVSITVRPQRLTDQEELMLHEHAGWFERVASGRIDEDNPLADVMRELKNDVFDAYPRAHAEQGLQVYNVLKRECRSLFTVRLQVVGDPIAQANLVEALGSEVMANAGNAYPSRWTRVEASDTKEFQWALFNLQWLEFVRWGISPLIQQSPAIVRLRQLATVLEASGAFRLPVAPSSGGLAGLDVRDEPFSSPVAALDSHDPSIALGTILDRGVPTGIPCVLPISAFSHLTQVFGEASESREYLLLELLRGAKAHGILWMLLSGSNLSYAHWGAQLEARHILVDASFRGLNLNFHPLLPPPGIPLTQFVDALVRVFMAVYMLDYAAGSLLRRALLKTYELGGWVDRKIGQSIDIAELATQIDAVAQQVDVPQMANLLRTRCVLALRDLVATAPNLRDAPYVRDITELEPTIFEFGWLGSDINSTLLRGCIWAWCSLALTQASATTQPTCGFVALMDAHTLFSSVRERSSSPALPTFVSPITALAQNIARMGVGTMCIDDRPDLLDVEVINKAGITILASNANRTAQEYAATMIGASPRQRIRMNRMNPLEVVVSVRGSIPMLIGL
jgi:hypothetical protein